MFVYDEDSQYCYFNPNTYETSDQYFLVGVVLGLAIYNSTILDVALPPFVFRKLLASAPTYTGPVTSLPRPSTTHTLADLAEFRRKHRPIPVVFTSTNVSCSGTCIGPSKASGLRGRCRGYVLPRLRNRKRPLWPGCASAFVS